MSLWDRDYMREKEPPGRERSRGFVLLILFLLVAFGLIFYYHRHPAKMARVQAKINAIEEKIGVRKHPHRHHRGAVRRDVS